jgi:hypothetical protein
MPRRTTGPRFVAEFALAPSPRQARILAIRLDLARQMYNAFLGEAWGRWQRCRRDPRWREAGTLRKATRFASPQTSLIPLNARETLVLYRPKPLRAQVHFPVSAQRL